jgi:hypothetical protein
LVGSDQPQFSEMGQRGKLRFIVPVQPWLTKRIIFRHKPHTSSASVKVDDRSSAGIATSQCRCIALDLTVVLILDIMVIAITDA